MMISSVLAPVCFTGRGRGSPAGGGCGWWVRVVGAVAHRWSATVPSASSFEIRICSVTWRWKNGREWGDGIRLCFATAA